MLKKTQINLLFSLPQTLESFIDYVVKRVYGELESSSLEFSSKKLREWMFGLLESEI